MAFQQSKGRNIFVGLGETGEQHNHNDIDQSWEESCRRKELDELTESPDVRMVLLQEVLLHNAGRTTAGIRDGVSKWTGW
jgi:hypothetical protein